MNLRDLKYLVALADSGNFARAADACHVSQPTLSTQVKKLEDELGVQLFERTSKRVVPTAAARDVIAQARVVLAEAEQLRALARGAADPFSGALRLGVIPTLGPYLVPYLLPKIRGTYPKLRLYLREALTAELLAQVRAGKLDACLVALPIADQGLETEPVFREPFLAALPASHPLAKKKKLRQSDLTGEQILLLEEGHCLRDQTLAVCGARRGAEDDYPATSLETLRQMVAAGVGITLMPALATRASAIGKRLLVFRPFSDSTPNRLIALVWRRGYARTAVMHALAELTRGALPATVTATKPRA